MSAAVPNAFYFLVPAGLGEKALPIIEAEAPYAGLLAYDESRDPGHREAVSSLKRARALRKAKPSSRMVTTALMRASSELCGLHILTDQLESQVAAVLEKAREDIIASAARLGGQLDIEHGYVKATESRARELAFCVDGIDETTWSQLPADMRTRWITAAQRLQDADRTTVQEWVDEPLYC